MDLQRNQEAACASYNPEWDPDSVSAIPTHSWLSRDTEVHGGYGLVVGKLRRINWGWPYRNQNQLLLQAITVPEVLGGSTLEHTYRQRIAAGDQLMSKPWKRSLAESTSTWRRVNRMKWQVNSGNDDMDTQTCDSEHTWRWSGKHTPRKGGEQLETISAPSTRRMSSVSTSAQASRMISATARSPERWWEDQVRLIYDEWVHLCIPKQFRTRPKMISERTK